MVELIIDKAVEKNKSNIDDINKNGLTTNRSEIEYDNFFDYIVTQTSDRKILHDAVLNIIFACMFS